MFSQKSQLIIISSLIAFVLIGISNALGTNEPMSERAPPISCEDLTVESNLVRQECLPVDDTDTLDCSFYFDAKKHSLLNDPATCLIFGYVRIPPSSLDHVCWSKLSTNACIQNDTSWLRVCCEIYYAGIKSWQCEHMVVTTMLNGLI